MLESASTVTVSHQENALSLDQKKLSDNVSVYEKMNLLKDEQYMMRGCLKVRVEEESFERVLKGRSVLRGAKNYRESYHRSDN